jgi:hypothetical protein
LIDDLSRSRRRTSRSRRRSRIRRSTSSFIHGDRGGQASM